MTPVLSPRIVEVRQGLLQRNDQVAAELRSRFTAAGLFVLNLVSSPGAGKTLLLERTLTDLRRAGWRVAALVGDLATQRDAERLARSGAPVRQINTHGLCHLEAEHVRQHLEGWSLAELDLLFIENVGNLVCTSAYDLGETRRAVLLSVTEGEDKPLKYPSLFNSADLAVISKSDLAGVCEFDRSAALAALAAVRPGLPTLELSAKTGLGWEAWLAYLQQERERLGSS
ncbi:MAG TPA: hydrogenase nickel incorporation protein HypB [Gemmatales bacterium]|nr:hydrogenase nickel incorporation protein HypB [Gemmatales bacterium]HMP60606.1 hydrogenase nickel incorporation protein HypB [Gemmatales bacterium]